MPQPKERAVPFQEENISFDISFLTFEDKECPLNGLTFGCCLQVLQEYVFRKGELFSGATSLQVTFSEHGNYMPP